jgi:hypothetical protein
VIGYAIGQIEEDLFCGVGAGRQFNQGNHVGFEIVGDFGIGLEFGQGPWARQRLAVLFETFRMKVERLGRVA